VAEQVDTQTETQVQMVNRAAVMQVAQLAEQAAVPHLEQAEQHRLEHLTELLGKDLAQVVLAQVLQIELARSIGLAAQVQTDL
jgi:formate dehydrogenase maturation protein FdhE